MHTFLFQMYDSVLLLEDLDRKSQLLEVYSEGKAELVERKDVIVDRAYSFLRLKAAGDTNKRLGCSWSNSGVGWGVLGPIVV